MFVVGNVNERAAIRSSPFGYNFVCVSCEKNCCILDNLKIRLVSFTTIPFVHPKGNLMSRFMSHSFTTKCLMLAAYTDFRC